MLFFKKKFAYFILKFLVPEVKAVNMWWHFTEISNHIFAALGLHAGRPSSKTDHVENAKVEEELLNDCKQMYNRSV